MIEPREQIDKKALLLLALNEGKYISDLHSINAQEVLAKMDFPTRKTEDWKYTRTNKISSGSWLPNAPKNKDISSYKLPDYDGYELVFINGEFIQELSTIYEQKGVTISPIKGVKNLEKLGFDSITNNEAIFTPLNTAFAKNGAFIHIEKSIVCEKPIHIINVVQANNTASQTRHLIVAEPLSQTQIIESFYSDEDTSFSNVLSEVFVKEGATVHYDKIQFTSANHAQVNSEFVHQEKNSNYTTNTITLNGGWIRNGLHIVVDGENCSTKLNGLYLLKDNQHVDNHTLVDHKKPHCISSELYKGFADDKATGIFNGKVFVREDAQKIQAFQQNNNILLSKDATINAKPELEICADDVKCSHGSTTGQFDEEAVFYLRTRGVSEDSARKLLVSAFANDVIDNIELESVKNKVYQLLQQRFGWNF